MVSDGNKSQEHHSKNGIICLFSAGTKINLTMMKCCFLPSLKMNSRYIFTKKYITILERNVKNVFECHLHIMTANLPTHGVQFVKLLQTFTPLTVKKINCWNKNKKTA
jgi:hypothetical protein